MKKIIISKYHLIPGPYLVRKSIVLAMCRSRRSRRSSRTLLGVGAPVPLLAFHLAQWPLSWRADEGGSLIWRMICSALPFVTIQFVP